MTVADYVLAVIGVLLALAAAGLAFLFAISGAFAPTPTVEHDRTSRRGCLWFLALLVLIGWLIGVLWTGSWGWVG